MDIKIPGYEIIREIGRGGMATVFLARQESFGREVAIKIMAQALASDEGFTHRFLKEGETVAKLMHPNIIKVFNAGVHGNHYYLAMEYFPRGTLRERIRQGLSTGDAVRILRSILEALRYAHGQGLIHRDIKSQNILLYEDGAPVISDFGLVKTAGGNTMMTSSGVAIGSPRYMSPEQIKGGHDIDERSDLYSVGVLFHEMLTGKVPYEAEDTFTIAFKHIYDPIPTLPNNLAAFQSYLERLLAKQREDRFPSAEAALVALDEIQTLRTARVPKTVVIDSEKLLHQQHLESQQSKGKRGSKVWKVTGTVMVLVVLIAGTAVFYLNWRQQPLPVTVERQQEEQRQAELERQQEEQRQAELERQQEEQRQAELERQQEEQRQAELERQQEEQRQAELERQQEEQRQAELERQQEEQRQAELERQQEEQRQAELERQQEEQRQAELERQQEEQRQAELERQQEEQRQAELERQQEEQRQAELERQQEEQRQAALKAQQQAAQLEQLLAQARQAQEAGDLALSLQRIASGLVMMPNSPELLSLLRDVEQQLAEVRQRQAEEQQTEQPAPQADPQQKIAVLMAEAQRRLRAKDYPSSLKQLDALLLLQPDHAKALQLKQQVQAEAEEARLRLNRDKRQWVQRALTELSFDTRGVDGIFGQNSRNAIRAFQRQRGFQVTGYLTAQQLNILEKVKPAVATAPPISLVSVNGSDTSAPQPEPPKPAGNTDPPQSTIEPKQRSPASDDAEKAKTSVAVSAEESKWKPVLASGERMLGQASSRLRRPVPARPARIGGAASNCSGDCRDGTGTFHFDNGDVYSGEWAGGFNSGKGSYFHNDGSVYVGVLSGGHRHGLGTFYYASGDKFYGDWRNGMRHGKGIYHYANGIKLYGNYRNGRLLEDAVVVFYNNGDKYVGQWKNDKKHGQGIYYERSGRKYAGVWRNNVKVKVVDLN